MKRLYLTFTTGLLLFALILYLSMSSIIFGLESEGVIENPQHPKILGTTTINGEAVAIENSLNVQNSEDSNEISKSVFSVINLLYRGETFVLQSAKIEDLLGNTSDLKEAESHWNTIGKDKTEYYLSELMNVQKYSRKNYQMNSNGILKEEVRGFEYYEQQSSPDVSGAKEKIHEIIERRLSQNIGIQEYVKVKSIEHLGTNGEYTDGKYVELDHSAQVIYAWEDGKLYKSWNASGFFDEYAVFGVFDLKNKSLKAWSPVVDKWMPYWMAFYYDNKQKAWYGLHELVYWYDAEGNRLEESSDSIGFKKSGGCVRLDRGEMVELYDWVDIGIPFLIHE